MISPTASTEKSYDGKQHEVHQQRQPTQCFFHQPHVKIIFCLLLLLRTSPFNCDIASPNN